MKWAVAILMMLPTVASAGNYVIMTRDSFRAMCEEMRLCKRYRDWGNAISATLA